MNAKILPSWIRWALTLVGVLSLVASATAAVAAPTNPSGFIIHRGTNLSHWLSQDFGWQPRQTWITRNDFQFITHLGFDHVRLPIDEKELWHDDGSANEEAFRLLRQGIGWAREYHLRVIVDLHTVRAHHFNAVNEGLHNTLFNVPKAQEEFVGLWRQLSARLHDQLTRMCRGTLWTSWTISSMRWAGRAIAFFGNSDGQSLRRPSCE